MRTALGGRSRPMRASAARISFAFAGEYFAMNPASCFDGGGDERDAVGIRE